MKEITLYREDNGQYSTSEAKQDDVSGVYVQKEHLTDLQAQNDELRAKLASLVSSKSCATCNNTGVCDYDDGFGGVASSPCHCTNNPYSTYSIINNTQIQSLADIKAEAVMSIMNKAHSCETANGDIAYSSELIHDHANRIKEG